MSEHTPGPWKIEASDDGHLILLGEAITNRHAHGAHLVIDYDHGVTPEDGDGTQYAEAEANAHLIAAAPVMLVALKAAEIALDMNLRSGDPATLASVRAAIALAEKQP